MTVRSGVRRRPYGSTVAAVLASAALLAGCGVLEGSGDELQVVEDPEPATAPPSPERTATPQGTVIGDIGAELTDTAAADVTALAVEASTRSLVVAVTDSSDGDDAGDTGAAVLFSPLDDPTAVHAEIPVPGAVEQLVPDNGSVVATLPGEDELIHLSPEQGIVGRTDVTGSPAGVTGGADTRLVAVRERAEVDVLEHEQRSASIGDGLSSADRVLLAGDTPIVLDRVRSAVFQVNLDDGDIGPGLRAGQGATHAVADRFGRVLVTDTRTDGLLAFDAEPLMLVQRYPVHGGIYAIAYDAERDIAWVTLTERNEVVGFDVAGGEPDEIHRFDSVRQPNSVTVDEQDGRVVVGSAAGEGIQVIEP
ncbi:hypothetical protein F8178_16340 [Haloechinothrix sp. LS1_15]|nr:hypothetical protein [Haloechinothrix sp. LS1_15]